MTITGTRQRAKGRYRDLFSRILKVLRSLGPGKLRNGQQAIGTLEVLELALIVAGEGSIGVQILLGIQHWNQVIKGRRNGIVHRQSANAGNDAIGVAFHHREDMHQIRLKLPDKGLTQQLGQRLPHQIGWVVIAGGSG